MTYPLLSLLICTGVGVFCFAAWAPGAEAAASVQETLLIPVLVLAYPLTFIWMYFGVALAATLAADLEARPITLGEGLKAAGRRSGAIARWSLVVCTVGLLLRLLGGRLPPAGRISASLAGLSWSLATVFAVPVLAYEGLGPTETLRRSAEVFKSRWGAEVGGDVGIGTVGLLLTIPFVLILGAGATESHGGAAAVVIGGAGLFAVVAFVGTVEQVYRVYLYRNAVGLDVGGGTGFREQDLRRPLRRGH